MFILWKVPRSALQGCCAGMQPLLIIRMQLICKAENLLACYARKTLLSQHYTLDLRLCPWLQGHSALTAGSSYTQRKKANQHFSTNIGSQKIRSLSTFIAASFLGFTSLVKSSHHSLT